MKSYKIVCSLVATLVSFGSLSERLDGAIAMHLWEDGDDVRAQASGTLDLSGLTFLTNLPFPKELGIQPNDPEFFFFGDCDLYSGLGFSLEFGSGGRLFGGTATGDAFGFESDHLIVPRGFVSGGSIFSEGVFSDTDLATLGASVGTYQYVLPNTDSVTFVIGSDPSTIPEPSAALFIGISGSAQKNHLN